MVNRLHIFVNYILLLQALAGLFCLDVPKPATVQTDLLSSRVFLRFAVVFFCG